MASRIDTSKPQKAFRRAAKDPAIGALAVAVYQKPLRDGLATRLLNTTTPNSQGWLDAKRRKGWGQSPFVRTGKTLKAVTNNPPTKVGSRRGIKVGVNWKNAVAFLVPMTLTDANGKRIETKKQYKIWRTHRYGSATQKIAASWEKLRSSKSPKAKYKALLHGSFENYLSSAGGVKDRQRQAAAKGQLGVPARPVFAWDRVWEEEMARDLQKAISEVLQKEGLDARS